MALPDDVQDPAGARPPGQRGEFWPTPRRYGAAEALVSMGTIAAPLLAGFSLAGFLQVLALSTNDVRWRDAPLLLLMLAALLLIGSVQATFWARQFQVTPGDLKDWWPDWQQPYRIRMIGRELADHNAGFRRWANLARTSYELGLLALISALTVLAVPPQSATGPLRWIAAAAGVIAFCAELCWGLVSQRSRQRRPAAQAPPAVGDHQDHSGR
jgi:hypothetical protein